MIKGQMDRAKLQASLRKFGKRFGDSSSQMIARWGVRTAVELAYETQAYGKRDAKKKQIAAMSKDANQIVFAVTSKIRRKDRELKSPDDVVNWIESHRKGKKKRTEKLAPKDRRMVRKSTFDKAIRKRASAAGMAKGGWLGAAMDMAARQKGQSKISVGKNVLSYAQKHAKFGKSGLRKTEFSPAGTITDSVRHSGLPYVLRSGAFRSVSGFALQKTVRWYRSAVRHAERKGA